MQKSTAMGWVRIKLSFMFILQSISAYKDHAKETLKK